MRVIAYDPKKEEFVRIKAVTESGGDVLIVVVDSNGHRVDRGNLLRITSEGRVKRLRRIDPKFGFDMDNEGRISLSPS